MSTINLTARQVTLLSAVLQLMKGPDVSWEEVSKVADFKTAKYARDTWTTVKNKLVRGSDEVEGAAGGTPSNKKKATATPRKRKTDGDDDETPSKKKATPRKTKKQEKKEAEEKAATEADDEADDDDEEEGVKAETADEP